MSDETVKNDTTVNENKTVKVNQETQVKQTNSILNAFKSEFSTSVIPIYINSLKRTVNFREVTVAEQKTLSKTMIQNENRKDIVYDTQCALINKVCLEDGFDIYKLTEFDRIRILMEIYATNFFQNDIEFKCPECGTVNKYKIDFEKVSAKLNEFVLDDKTYKMEDRVRYYNFTINYPQVYNVSNFYKNYMKQYKNVTKKEQEVLDNLGNIEYINLFIKNVELIKKDDTTNKMNADLTMMSYNEIEELLSVFPQNIVFDDDHGVLKYITTEFIDQINKVFQYEKCAQCGHQTNQGMGDLIDFF